ncbi:MAG: gamma-glutamyltransferase family protein [Herpetosiphonaceae bacterium]|nr:gamma-glutamyltransferase family protein [Herpetosiphonaceae bacterium]
MKLLDLPYSSRRMPTVARNGMVATSQPLAALAGLAMLEAGGTAVDAAIAAAAMLPVVEPTSNGIGGDAFALVWDGARMHGLNGSGRAPAALNLELVRGIGHATMPTHGWLPVTVPGVPRAWHDLHARFGRLDFERILSPAISAAEDGYAVTPIVAQYWAYAARNFAALTDPALAEWRNTFAHNGHAPAAGDVWRSRRMARTLRRIAQSNSADFYTGELAERMVQFAQRTGGYLTAADLERHTSTWVDPISTNYRGYDVWEIPPNGQGLTALLALNILEGFDLSKSDRESVQAYHLQIEAMKLAFADAQRYIADPEHVHVPTAALLSKEYAARRRALIGETAQLREPGQLPAGGTVYLCVADGDGMMVSYIQSNYMGFGSGVVVPETGIALQNRGAGFALDPAHPNVLAPGKRPYHTIIPSFLTRDGAAIGPFGVMGGYMQPQGHAQMVLNTLDWKLNPQASLDAPRWQFTDGLNVMLEYGVSRHIIEGLQALGHRVSVQAEGGAFGRGQIIWRMPSGSLVGGSDMRADGLAIGF